jgi:hypothetical protein
MVSSVSVFIMKFCMNFSYVMPATYSAHHSLDVVIIIFGDEHKL